MPRCNICRGKGINRDKDYCFCSAGEEVREKDIQAAEDLLATYQIHDAEIDTLPF